MTPKQWAEKTAAELSYIDINANKIAHLTYVFTQAIAEERQICLDLVSNVMACSDERAGLALAYRSIWERGQK